MIICPNCGAGNKTGSSVCRMCASSMEGSGEASQGINFSSTADIKTGLTNPQEGEATVEQQGIVCPDCDTMNEIGWSFCQQCGKRLIKSPQSPSTPDLKMPVGLKTVPEQHAVSDPGFAHDMNTIRDERPQSDHGLKTVAEEGPSTLPGTPPTKPRPIGAAPSEAPTASVKPVPAKPDPLFESPTVVIPPPIPPGSAAPSASRPDPKPSPPPASMSEQSTRPVHSVSGVLCTQCGQANSVGSGFCASCGAPITYGKTMVMSSQRAPIKGRLHLVMEGGQPGEVYELGEDTVIGRSNGEITFPHDGFMSGRHARIIQRDGSFVLTDEGSRNGTFVKINAEVSLKPGDMILVGKQLFRFEV
ncbi:MAG: FHA domain-containing protein [Blastocatellia bacterium]